MLILRVQKRLLASRYLLLTLAKKRSAIII
jgi:hypothetical protein